MKPNYRITISLDEGIPEGTALLRILGELIKEVPGVVEMEPGQRFSFHDYVDDKKVYITVSRLCPPANPPK